MISYDPRITIQWDRRVRPRRRVGWLDERFQLRDRSFLPNHTQIPLSQCKAIRRHTNSRFYHLERPYRRAYRWIPVPAVLARRKVARHRRRSLPVALDVIRTVRPRWVVGENVYGIVNWSEGLVFEQVCADLEAAGYEVQPYIIPACGVGAPHRRDRCWFVAHRTDAGAEAMREREDGFYAVEPVAHPDGDRRRKRPNEQKPLPECVGTSDAGNGVENGIVAYSDRQRCEECNASCQSGHTQRTTQNSDAKRRIPDWNGFPTQPPVCGGDDGFPGELAGIAFPRWRREAVKACGNAIVPQVALRIFETINEYEVVKQQDSRKISK